MCGCQWVETRAAYMCAVLVWEGRDDLWARVVWWWQGWARVRVCGKDGPVWASCAGRVGAAARWTGIQSLLPSPPLQYSVSAHPPPAIFYEGILFLSTPYRLHPASRAGHLTKIPLSET